MYIFLNTNVLFFQCSIIFKESDSNPRSRRRNSFLFERVPVPNAADGPVVLYRTSGFSTPPPVTETVGSRASSREPNPRFTLVLRKNSLQSVSGKMSWCWNPMMGAKPSIFVHSMNMPKTGTSENTHITLLYDLRPMRKRFVRSITNEKKIPKKLVKKIYPYLCSGI